MGGALSTPMGGNVVDINGNLKQMDLFAMCQNSLYFDYFPTSTFYDYLNTQKIQYEFRADSQSQLSLLGEFTPETQSQIPFLYFSINIPPNYSLYSLSMYDTTISSPGIFPTTQYSKENLVFYINDYLVNGPGDIRDLSITSSVGQNDKFTFTFLPMNTASTRSVFTSVTTLSRENNNGYPPNLGYLATGIQSCSDGLFGPVPIGTGGGVVTGDFSLLKVTNSVPTQLSIKLNRVNSNGLYSYSFNTVIPPNAQMLDGCLLSSQQFAVNYFNQPFLSTFQFGDIQLPSLFNGYVYDTSESPQIPANTNTDVKTLMILFSILQFFSGFAIKNKVLVAFGAASFLFSIFIKSKTDFTPSANYDSEIWLPSGSLTFGAQPFMMSSQPFMRSQPLMRSQVRARPTTLQEFLRR